MYPLGYHLLDSRRAQIFEIHTVDGDEYGSDGNDAVAYKCLLRPTHYARYRMHRCYHKQRL